MSASALDPEPITPDEFHRSLSIEYDATLVRLKRGLYHMLGVYCDECDALNGLVFVNNIEQLRRIGRAAGLEFMAFNKEAAGEYPEVGALACTECGSCHGCDLRGEIVRVLKPEDYRQYAGFRAERGEPI